MLRAAPSARWLRCEAKARSSKQPAGGAALFATITGGENGALSSFLGPFLMGADEWRAVLAAVYRPEEATLSRGRWLKVK